ncbi:MAG: hypothetical protein LBH04_11720 [Tannerellaceae bacterium]|jgi:hypothetical protein|nr:hypothetical protein [Tannerellaceae bacterium]
MIATVPLASLLNFFSCLLPVLPYLLPVIFLSPLILLFLPTRASQWRSKNNVVAQDAVGKIKNQEKLAEAAAKARVPEARAAAIRRLIPAQHYDLLEKLAKEDESSIVRNEARIVLTSVYPQQKLAAIASSTEEDVEVRISAIDALAFEEHQPLLEELAQNADEDIEVRVFAIGKLLPEPGRKVLEAIALTISPEGEDEDEEVRIAAIERLAPEHSQELFIQIALGDKSDAVREVAVGKIIVKPLENDGDGAVESDAVCDETAAASLQLMYERNHEILSRLAVEDEYSGVRIEAVYKLVPEQSQSLLAKIATTDESFDVRDAAVEFLIPAQHQSLLADIATTDSDWHVRESAVWKLSPEENEEVLLQISLNDEKEKVRSAARKRLNKDDDVL